MKKLAVFAALTSLFGGYGASIDGPRLSRRRLKSMRPKRYRPAFTMGYRGLPKTYVRPGAMAAPTIDQVRDRERKYGQRIHVKQGLMFFANDSIMWTADEARRRQAA